MSREMYNYKRKAVRIAKDFRYTMETSVKDMMVRKKKSIVK